MGDMHLDSPFAGLTVQESERMRGMLRDLFRQILSSAASECDALLISGDLFDQGFVSPETLEMVKTSLGGFPGPVYIAPGNHDPYAPNSIWTAGAWPENVNIFTSSAMGRFDSEAAGEKYTVWGWAFTSPRLDDCPLGPDFSPDPGRINILCAHADTSDPISRYCPLPLSLIEAAGFEYAALGHIHRPPEAVMAGRTLVAYSGFPQGRGWDEPGRGRVLYVSVSPGSAEIEVRPTGFMVYESVTVDITGSGSDAETAGILSERIAGLPDPGRSVSVTLTGAVSPSYTPDTRAVAAAAFPEGSSVRITDETSPVFGASYLENDMSVKGELYRTLLPELTSSDPDRRSIAAEALRIGLLALDGRPFMRGN